MSIVISNHAFLRFTVLAACLAFPGLLHAQNAPASGLYQITGGRHTLCCGFGGPIVQLLPSTDQSYILVTVDAQGNRPVVAILGEDQETVLTEPALLSRPAFRFALSNGVISSAGIEFRSPAPGPDPRAPSYSYRVSGTAGGLLLQGRTSLPCLGCADVPNDFTHSNVVASLVVSAPRLEGVVQEGGRLRFRFTGEPGYIYSVEFSDHLQGGPWLPLTMSTLKCERQSSPHSGL